MSKKNSFIERRKSPAKSFKHLQPVVASKVLDDVVALYQTRKYTEALLCAEAALSLMPTPSLLNVAAVSAIALGRRDLAEKYWRTTIQIQPEYVEAHYNLGKLLQELERVDEAEAFLRKAIDIRPQFVEAYNNLGSLLKELNRYEEAEIAFRQALAHCPEHTKAYYNLGNLLKELKRYEEAETAFRKALALRPGYAEAQWNLSLLLLAQGRFKEAWPFHEARYHSERKESIGTPNLPCPQWRGEPLLGV